MQGQVKIGPEFFQKAFNDYADKHWAWVREIYQNGVDARRCGRIEFSINTDENGNTIAIVENDGIPMTEEVLIDRLLSLGGSGKNFGTEEASTIGGFGKAKEVLMLAHPSYSVHTGGLLVEGSGGAYTLSQVEPIRGTRTTVLWDGDHTQELRDAVRKMAAFAQWKGELVLDGETLETDLKKGARRKEFTWGVIYSNNTFANVAVVRIDGIPMFARYARFKGCIVVELKGRSSDTLTSNRDNLKYPYSSEFGDFLTALAIDKRSALREQKAQYKRYLGEKLKAEKAKPKVAEQTLDDIVDVAAFVNLVAGPARPGGEPVPATVTEGGIRLVVENQEDVRTEVGLGFEFIIKNTTGMVTPEYYTPGPLFSKYSRDLARVWAAVLVKLHQVLGHSDTFSVGFVLDEENLAECEKGPYGRVYYLNPARVVCQRSKPQCRSFRARYTGAWTNRHEILAVACHEIVHGMGYGEHDEDYSAKLTEVMGVAFANFKEFAGLFRD